jgi:Na+-transporting NADH:ubiquinone oxidoreductase subunit NqrF
MPDTIIINYIVTKKLSVMSNSISDHSVEEFKMSRWSDKTKIFTKLMRFQFIKLYNVVFFSKHAEELSLKIKSAGPPKLCQKARHASLKSYIFLLNSIPRVTLGNGCLNPSLE